MSVVESAGPAVTASVLAQRGEAGGGTPTARLAVSTWRICVVRGRAGSDVAALKCRLTPTARAGSSMATRCGASFADQADYMWSLPARARFDRR